MDDALKTMINNTPEKTGKSLAEWSKILKSKNFAKHSEAVKFLKEQGVTHGYANTIVTLSKDDKKEGADLVKEQYQGKEGLMPIYKKLIDVVDSFGADVIKTPKKASVSVIRKKQFALIKPATKTRIDLGLKLRHKAVEGRLENSGPFGTMCTHRVRLSAPEEVNDEVIGWLREAYEEST